MALTPRLVVEVFEHVNYKGRKVTVIDSVVNTGEVGLPLLRFTRDQVLGPRQITKQYSMSMLIIRGGDSS